jgi:TonB family protein
MALTPQIVMPNPEPPKIKNPSLPVVSTVYGDPKALPELKGPIGEPDWSTSAALEWARDRSGYRAWSWNWSGSWRWWWSRTGARGNAGAVTPRLAEAVVRVVPVGVYVMGQDGVGRIQILFKEKAKYTEEARQNKIQGTVVLSAVFTSDGQVTSVRVIRGLPDGLTEKAIEAAKKIRFQPATKNGAAVTVRGQLEFTFNLYKKPSSFSGVMGAAK